MIRRYLAAAGAAAVVTTGLFLLMQSLISMGGSALSDPLAGQVIEFIRLKKDSELELKKREMPEKQKREMPPPPPMLDMARSERPDQDIGAAGMVAVPTFEPAGGPDLGAPPSDADIIPLVRVKPQYPSRALSMGIEGWVDVEFTISAAGTVVDPVVVDSTSGVFHTATLRAVRKWKYNPKIVDGQPVERPNVRVRINFNFSEGS